MSISQPSSPSVRADDAEVEDAQRPIVRRNLSQLVADRIRRLVAQQRLGPGDTLPSVTKLSETYEVSTTCVREALKKLEGLGLVRGVQRKGFVLVEPTLAPLLEWVNFSTERDRQRYFDLLIARSTLEPAIMPLVAEAATEEDFERLESLLQRAAEVCNDWEAFNEREAEFHRELYRATHNSALEAFGQMCCECFTIPHEAEDKVRATVEANVEHGALLVALRAGDVDTAQHVAREHLRTRREREIAEGEAEAASDAGGSRRAANAQRGGRRRARGWGRHGQAADAPAPAAHQGGEA